jgi:hypothetical protein
MLDGRGPWFYAAAKMARRPRRESRQACPSVELYEEIQMAKKAAPKSTVVFTVTCKSNDSLSGMVQTEDQDENEERVMFDSSGTATMKLPPGDYTFVWAVKMSPIKRHHYGIKAERIDNGNPVLLRNRPKEQTTTTGEDVGFDDFSF